MADAKKVIRLNYKAYMADADRLYDTTDEAAAKEAGIYNEKVKYAPMSYLVGSTPRGSASTGRRPARPFTLGRTSMPLTPTTRPSPRPRSARSSPSRSPPRRVPVQGTPSSSRPTPSKSSTGRRSTPTPDSPFPSETRPVSSSPSEQAV